MKIGMAGPVMEGQKQSRVDPDDFRNAMGHFVTGVTIVTSAGHSGPTGMTVNSFTSVSLDPCQLLVCLKRNSSTGISIRESGYFAVCLLSKDQKDLAMKFSKPAAERFHDVSWFESDLGPPIIRGNIANLVCKLHTVHAAGDHDIFIGDVRSCVQAGFDPLVFFRGRFDLIDEGARSRQLVHGSAR